MVERTNVHNVLSSIIDRLCGCVCFRCFPLSKSHPTWIRHSTWLKYTLTLLSVFIGNWFIPHILFKPKKPTISLSVCFFVEIVVSSSEFQLSPQPNTQQNGVSEDKGWQPHRRNGWYALYHSAHLSLFSLFMRVCVWFLYFWVLINANGVSTLIILFKWGLSYNHPFSSLNMLQAFLGPEYMGVYSFLKFCVFPWFNHYWKLSSIGGLSLRAFGFWIIWSFDRCLKSNRLSVSWSE